MRRGSCLLFALIIGVLLPSTVNAKDRFVLATSAFVPPYVIKTGDTGIQLEIVKAALMLAGEKNIDVVYLSNKRMIKQLEAGRIDAMLNIPPQTHGQHIHISDSVINYLNVAITLQSKSLTIEDTTDLVGLSVLAFQNAKAYLGESYQKVIPAMESYEEVVNQMAQIDHLMKGWTDVIVLDSRVYDFYESQYVLNDTVLPITRHLIFKSAPRPLAFRDKQKRDAFNQALKKLHQLNMYQALLAGEKAAELVSTHQLSQLNLEIN